MFPHRSSNAQRFRPIPNGPHPRRRTKAAAKIKTLCLKAERARGRCDHEASRKALEQALALDETCSDAIWWLGDYWHTMGKREPALKFYRRYLRQYPGDPEALHMIASLGGRSVPKRAPDGYLKLHFDSYAEDFDTSLVKELEYQAPKVLARTIARVRGRRAGKADICDLGCGTGLVGLELKPIARSLTGVDLSRKMLSLARARRIYDRLSDREVTRFLKSNRASYDLITAADVLIYIGDIEPMFAAAARALRPGGLLAVSAERTTEEAFVLTETGRYAHNPAWLRKVATANGFVVRRDLKARLRYEVGKPVMGTYLVAQKPA